jgi:hypothetical protein
MAQRKVEWTLPTTYSDGSAIPAEVAAKLVTHIYRDAVEVGVSAPGATEAVIEVAEVPGQSYVYTGRCEVDGIDDPLSAPSEVALFTAPFLVAGPPTGLRIS